MTRHLLIVLPTCFLALIIFIFSVYNASAIEYEFVLTPTSSSQSQQTISEYNLPDLPLVLPDNPVWLVKAAQDRIRILAHLDAQERAEELIFISNERLVVAKEMFAKGEYEIGMSTLSKAEKYLYSAFEVEKELRNQGDQTSFLLQKLAQASATHTRVIDQILTLAPGDATPLIVQAADTPKRILEVATTLLRAMGQEIVSISL